MSAHNKLKPGFQQNAETKDDFKNWFGDSVVKHEGLPLVVFHGTSTAFDPHDMHALSHFGSAEGAHLRLRNIGSPVVYPVYLRICNPLIIPDTATHGKQSYRRLILETYGTDVLTEKELDYCFGKSERAGAPEIKHRRSVLRAFFLFAKRISGAEKTRELEIDKPSPLEEAQASDILHPDQKSADNLWIDRMIRLLEDKGYDGFVYQNKVEDKHSISYIPFRARQVRSVYAFENQSKVKYMSRTMPALNHPAL